MSAIRRDEETDNIHSLYVDQWDWEKIIYKDERKYLHSNQQSEVFIRHLRIPSII